MSNMIQLFLYVVPKFIGLLSYSIMLTAVMNFALKCHLKFVSTLLVPVKFK